MVKHRVVFLGTPKIAATCLQALIDCGIDVVAVVTKEDKPIGRKKEIIPSAVKALASEHHILVLQPHKIIDVYDELLKIKPDLILTCAYGQIVPDQILQLPQYKCVNVHTSLLPRWRGGAPIHHAILNGDSQSGVTLMYMASGLDTGDIIYQQAINLDRFETYESLYDRLSELAYKMIVEHIDDLFNTNIKTIKQDESKVTYAKNISREDEKINWNADYNQIECQVRGLYNQPIAYTIYQGLNVKVHEALGICSNEKHLNGTIIHIDTNGIQVAANNGMITITKLQLPSKSPILVKHLINGNHPFKINTKFD